jgi:hypothetical protein
LAFAFPFLVPLVAGWKKSRDKEMLPLVMKMITITDDFCIVIYSRWNFEM